MKKQIIYISLLVIALLTACSSGTETVEEVSSDATVSSLTFTANDSFPGLDDAVFTIEELIDTGLIYNVDSLLFGTRVDSVIPIFRFNYTPATVMLYTPFDTTVLSGSDTINFTQNPSRLQVIASDQVTEKWYHINVNVHQVDPDLFVWEQMATDIYPAEGAEQKVLGMEDKLYLFVNNGFANTLYTSSNAKVWEQHPVSGLPQNCQVRNMLQAGGKLYYGQDNILYTSLNGTEWTATDFALQGISFSNMLFEFNDSIWAIIEDSNAALQLATSKDGNEWTIRQEVPADFPISDYAALSFTSATNRRRAMIVGGFAQDGTSLNTRWNVEYSPDKGYRWKNFSIEQPDFQSLTGVSVVWYNDRFYMFGGVDADNQIGEYTILESLDEGLNWQVPDSASNLLPENYTPRSKTSVTIGSDNAIYILGGQSRTQIFSDAFRGKLNSIDW